MLELDHVSKDYVGPGETIHAVRDISMSIAPGEFVSLLGPSGSGKTTLLLLSAGIIHSDAGQVTFEGRPISEMSEKESATFRRSHLGFIFQNFNLMPGTAADNVALPLRLAGVHPRQALSEAKEMLAVVGLEKRFDHIANRLSGGERQRVAIARALVHAPQLVLADEPTGNLDSERGTQVLSMLRELCSAREAAVLLVTHDERSNRFADRVLRMSDGHLVGEGPSGELETESARVPV